MLCWGLLAGEVCLQHAVPEDAHSLLQRAEGARPHAVGSLPCMHYRERSLGSFYPHPLGCFCPFSLVRGILGFTDNRSVYMSVDELCVAACF